MKIWKLLAVAGILALVLGRKAILNTTRSVALADSSGGLATADFDRAQSAGLFIGIQQFTKDGAIQDVEYAVDDAIDLAYAFALEPRTRLIPPSRVILALSGSARKQKTRQKLAELEAAGAIRVSATPVEIFDRLRRQAASAGRHGLLVVGLATHGFSNEGTSYLLSATSTLQQPDTSLSASQLLDLAAAAGAVRSLILVDACRERLKAGARAGEPDPASASPDLNEAMTATKGQAVLWAATAGGYAYDDAVHRNGVFTYAVLQGLQCRAKTDPRGFVTVDTLADYVEQQVRDWVVKHRDTNLASATQSSFDGAAKDMPLVQCREPLLPSLPPTPFNLRPAYAAVHGSSVEAFGKDGVSLWKRHVGGNISHVEVADLDTDGTNEVLVGVGSEGEDADKIIVFKADGEVRWTGVPYADAPSVRSGITTFLVDQLVRGDKRRQVAAISASDQGSRVTIFEADGERRVTYPFAGRLQHLAFLKTTSHHWPKLVVSGATEEWSKKLDGAGRVSSVMLLNPYNRGADVLVWSGAILPSSRTIEGLEIRDYGNDGRRDIAMSLSNGSTIYVDVKGDVVHAAANASFLRMSKEPHRAAAQLRRTN